ncbi:MAG: hypothetical protein IPP69_07895 [Flavobacteriales bacterium]|nr:hypothetical protein [Flavobacteriales bacterium]
MKQIEYFGDIAAKNCFNTLIARISHVMLWMKVVTQFFKSYFLKLGFLDGSTGLDDLPIVGICYFAASRPN